MAQKSETKITNAIIRELRQRGAWCTKIHGSVFQARGTEDIIACVAGRFVAIEVKTPTGKESPTQVYTRGQIIKAGGEAVVCTSVQDMLSSIFDEDVR